MVASLLAHVPYISLDGIRPSPLEEFNFLTKTTQNLRIKELQLDISDVDSWEGPVFNFAMAERFIGLHAQRLKKLNTTVTITSGSQSAPFRFPALPSLTFFGIRFRNRNATNPNFGNGFLALFTPNQVPVLEKVFVKDTFEEWENDKPHTDAYFPLNGHFNSVSKLTLYHCSPRDDWNRVFPNLNDLNVGTYIANEALAADYFSYTGLERLTLELGYGMETEINSLLSGIPDPDAVYGMSEDEIGRVRGPSILQLTKLTNLRKLSIGVAGYERMLTEAGLSLLQIQPLDLSLRIYEISGEVEAKLKAHHRSFTRIPFRIPICDFE